MAEKPGISPNDILMAVTTLSFDIAVLELFLPLISGAQVVIVPREIAYDGARLLEKIKSSKATIMQATPATWRLLIHAMWQGEPELKILCGGEALPRDLANELIDRSANVWNMYGPTETTVWSTCWKIEKKEGPILIGRPIANTQVYILDHQMQPVPVGVAGDLYIGGEGLARGYLNRPDLTNKVFLQNSFHINSPNARIYKTGDSARYHNDGNIEYINRSDNQVKIRGFRIELGEIETVLLQHKAVQNAVVIVWEGRPGDKRLIAYIVPKQDMDIVEKQLRDELRQKLPEYMLPQHFIKIDALPLTPNGKIDRRALHVLKVDISSCNEEYIPPDSSTEKMLAEIWKDIISLPRVGRTDNFFEIGGHSVLAVQMISMVLKVFNVELPLRTVFETKTLTDLSQYVDALLYAATSASAALNENSAAREEIEF
jgi:acyl-coenzyme A synthetase/AMP-(fatty) acid ligase/acyl carrier protein